MKKILVKSGKVFSEDLLKDCDILISDGVIEELIFDGNYVGDVSVVDASDHLVIPGFVDLQIYGSGGSLFSAYPTVETLSQMDNDLLSKGTTSFLACVATNSRQIFHAAIAAAKEYMPFAKGFLGLHLEGPYLNPKRLGAHPLEYVHKATVNELRELLDHDEGVVKMMTIAYELQDADVIDYLQSKGIILSLGHSDATFEEATFAYDNGVTTTTHLYNAMPPIHHRNVSLPVATLNHSTAFASIIVDGLHVDYELVKLSHKLMKDRLYLITDAVTSCSIGPYHHMLLPDGKYVTADGILSGSSLTMLQAVANCVHYCDISMEAAIRMATAIPSSVYSKYNSKNNKATDAKVNFGRIEIGQRANLVIVSSQLELKNVLWRGQAIV